MTTHSNRVRTLFIVAAIGAWLTGCSAGLSERTETNDSPITEKQEGEATPIATEQVADDAETKESGDSLTRSYCWVTLWDCTTGFGGCTSNGRCTGDQWDGACRSLRSRYCGR